VEDGALWVEVGAPPDCSATDAEDLAGQLSGVGLDVLYDDRKASPGVKFTDAEVLGMPIAVVVGRGLKNGVVEVRNRRTGERREVPVAEAVTAVRELTGR